MGSLASPFPMLRSDGGTVSRVWMQPSIFFAMSALQNSMRLRRFRSRFGLPRDAISIGGEAIAADDGYRVSGPIDL